MDKNKYQKAMENVHISKEAQQKILEKSVKFNKKERINTMSKKKITLIAAAAVMVLGITAFAASGIISSWNSSSSSVSDYTELPTAEQCIKDVGYAPILIEQFENGYTFNDGSIVSNSLEDESGKSVEKFKSFTFRYTKDDNELLLSQEKFNSEMENYGEIISSDKGVDIYYNEYTNKLVPPDYELTEEDKKAEANGDLVFSYGSAEVTVQNVKVLSWKVGDLHCSITAIDSPLSSDELVEMAYEIIQNK